MKVLNARLLGRFGRKHRDAVDPLARWLEFVEAAAWSSLVDVRRMFPNADGITIKGKGGIKTVVAIFNIKGNEYRLITVINYPMRLVIIRDVLTHAEYSKDSWKDRI